MPAKYLEVFSVVYKDFFSDKSKKIENWIVNISESKDLYIVELSIPWNKINIFLHNIFIHISHNMSIYKNK
jgi:hypothetical protein